MGEISNELYVKRLYEEIERMRRRREVRNKKVGVTTGGVKYRHGIGAVPKVVNAVPQSDFYVWEYERRDGTFVYLKSSADGDVLLTVIGD